MALHDLLRRLYVIERETDDGQGGARKGQADEGLDEFGRVKRDVARQVKDVRLAIKERNELLEKQPGTKQTVEQSARIRQLLRQAKDDASRLETLQKNQAAKRFKGKGDTPEVIEHRQEVVELVNKHIEECEQLEKRRFTPNAAGDRSVLFGGRTAAATGVGMQRAAVAPTETSLPDIEVQEGLQQLKRRDDQLDRHLDDIEAGVGELMNVAVEIGQEVRTQNVMIDEITEKVDSTTDHLKNINRKMKKTLQSVRKGDKLCLDIILLCVLLGLIGYLINII